MPAQPNTTRDMAREGRSRPGSPAARNGAASPLQADCTAAAERLRALVRAATTRQLRALYEKTRRRMQAAVADGRLAEPDGVALLHIMRMEARYRVDRDRAVDAVAAHMAETYHPHGADAIVRLAKMLIEIGAQS